MAQITYQFDFSPTLRSDFITDDVAGTTTINIVNKSTGNTVLSFTATQLDTLLRNREEWAGLRRYNDLIGFTKV